MILIIKDFTYNNSKKVK